MPKKTKQKLLVGDHSRKWYLLYGFFSCLIVVGFFQMFYYYSQLPIPTALQIQEIDTTPETVEEVLALHYNVPVIEPKQGEFQYIPIFFIITGSVGFLGTKYFYIKPKKRYQVEEWLK